MTEMINSAGYDVPSDYMSIFCFEGLYETCLYYAEQLKNKKDEEKVREDMRKVCRLLAKAVMAIAKK